MPRPTKPILTEWETTLIQIVWDNPSICASEIREILRERDIKRSDPAIRKTLGVMEEKGAIEHNVENRTFLYKALIKKNDAERTGIEYISDLLFGGSVGSLVMRAIDEADLTPQMIKKIKKRLKEKKK